MGLPELSIPEDKLPLCWSDDVRMNALFAPFRLKTANPESWQMKMKFWSEMLRLWCKYKKDPIVSAGDAKFAFQRNGRTPFCIDIVIEEMFRNGEFCPISKYQQILHNGPEGWVKWGARIAFRPAVFALTAVASLMPGKQALDGDGLPKASIDSSQRFVLESAVMEQAMEMLENYPPGVERIGTIDELMRNAQWEGGREVFELLLGWLVSRGEAVKSEDLVKLAEPNKKALPITEADAAVAKLSLAHSRLLGDSERLAREVAAARALAARAAKAGDQRTAKGHLRRMHRTQRRLEQCAGALENVALLQQQLRDAEQSAHIVDTYKTTSEAMKRGMKEGGLEEDSVHNTMDDLKEVMETYNEVERALAGSTEEIDMAELEKELEELVHGPGSGGSAESPESLRKEQPKSQERSKIRKASEREFIFDGEEMLLAELNELDLDDASPKQNGFRRPKKVAVAETEAGVEEEPKELKESKTKPSKPWYPPAEDCLRSWRSDTNNNPPDDGYGEVRLDERLHPGQTLSADFTTPPRLYRGDFVVRDHVPRGGVWLFNADTDKNTDRNTDTANNTDRKIDTNKNIDTDLAASTEYFSSESPGKSGGNFQMAPGGERKKTDAWGKEDPELDDIERRLKNLRGFNL